MNKLRLRTTLKASFLLLVICIAFGSAGRVSTRTGHPHHSPGAGSGLSVIEAYGAIPLHFEANAGQIDHRVKFLARGTGYTVFLAHNEAVLVLSRPAANERNDQRVLNHTTAQRPSISRAVLRLTFAGANKTPHVKGLDQLPGKANYFKGNDPANWRTNIPTYERVRYENLYPGIDLKYYGNQRQLEYDFVVQPRADPHRIALDFKGAERIDIERNGDLVLRMGDTEVRQRKPFIYQEVDGERREISGGYVFRETSRIGFRIAAYDSSRPLIIDPVLFYSTYLGGSDIDSGSAIVVDSAGNAYLTGYVRSSDFPTTAGAFQPDAGGDYDAFVTKLNPTGSGLVYSTYLGGTSFDNGGGVALDTAGNIYVVGPTDSTDFPTTAGAFATTYNGGLEDGFVTKLNATGSGLVYSTYLGGDSDDGANGIAVDATGSAVVAGFTSSTDFPTTVLAFDTTFNGGLEDAFVTKLDPAGSGLLYSTYLGGSGDDFIVGTALDAAGNAYVAGTTASSDYPTTVGAFDTTFNGGDYDAFVTKLNVAGSGLVYSTFLGGSMIDGGNGLTVDATGSAYIGGTTHSMDFPTTAGAFQPAPAGMVDIFVTKINAAGSSLVYSTYLGGSNEDFGAGVAVDATGNVYASGATFSSDFPIAAGAFQPAYAGNLDAVIAKIDPTGSELVYSSYLGGTDLDGPQGIALDSLPNPNAYVVGFTYSIDFPTTPGAFDTTVNGDRDAFVAKIAEGNPAGGPFTERVTGGGTIDVVGGIASFSFMISRSSTGVLSGHLQYFNHVSGAHVRSETYASLLIVGNAATFDGDCTVNGSPCTFDVSVADNGEPGTTDTFAISVSGEPTEGGTLRSGNILIQQ